jgi:putative ABC transport system permease protein
MQPPTLVKADADAIASQVPTVQEVAPALSGSEIVSYRSNNSTASLVGATPSYLIVRNFDVAKGRFITNDDLKRQTNIAVLGSEIAEILFGKDDPVGQSIRIKNTSLQVVGVMQPKGAAFGDNQDLNIFLPLTTMSNRIAGRSSPYGMRVSFISVSVKDETMMTAAQFQIENLLRLRHKIVKQDDFTVRNQKDLMSILGNITGALTLLLACVAAISLVVGGIGIMNIMLVSVTERTKEIGLRKAIGASQEDILIQFIVEAVILSVTGGFIGTAIGIGGIFLVAAFSPLQASVSVSAIAIAVGVSGGIGLFFGVVPARQAARLDPIVALRSI